jgi:alanine racemase
MTSLVENLVEIKLNDDQDFLKIKETLTRMGVSSRKEKKLFQSCHILHKQNKYYITHFKELFILDGKHSDISEEDIARRNTIIHLLEEWGLLQVVDSQKIKEPRLPVSNIKIIPHKEKHTWDLIAKYTIGKKRIRND